MNTVESIVRSRQINQIVCLSQPDKINLLHRSIYMLVLSFNFYQRMLQVQDFFLI